MLDPTTIDWEEMRRRLLRLLRASHPSLPHDLAEDLVQEATVRLLRTVRRPEGPGPLSSSYLRKVVVSALIDEVRRRRRRGEESLESEDAMVEQLPDLAARPEQAATESDLRQAVSECLVRMAAPRRRAVVLYLLGFGVPELAERTGWDAKRAENLVYRGREDLRRCLNEKGYEP